MLVIDQINELPEETFVKVYGHLFEHSPWIARGAAAKRPFADCESMRRAFLSVIDESSMEEQFALLRAHPELAGKEAREDTLTRDSASEQASSGLDTLTAAEVTEMCTLNKDYRCKHGFPFIACVKHFTKAGIFYELRRRLNRKTSEEFATALEQIKAIAGFRLADLIGSRVAPP